jgi:peptide/nickel transport system substrate-binding protein
MKRHRNVVVGMLLLVLMTVGPIGYPAQAAPAGTVTIVQGPDPVSLDPTIDVNKTSVNIQLGIFDTLVRSTADGRLSPGLATAWRSVSANTWRFTLRKGIKYQNGEPFTSESVVFSIHTYNASQGEGRTFFQFIKEVKVVDEYTVDLLTDGPNPVVPSAMAFLMLLPPHYYAQTGPGKFGTSPIGTGPYRFVTWEQGVRILLRADPAYWGGAPSVAEFQFKPAPEASTRVALLETGDSDIIANVPPEVIDRIKRSGRADVRWTPSLRILFVEMNVSQRPLSDVRVRRAANLAIDKASLVKDVLGGYAERRAGIIPPGWLGSNPPDKLTRYDYNPGQAKTLLREAGYPDGITVDFWYPIGRYLKDKEVAEALMFMFNAVGIKTQPHGSDIGTLVQRIHTQTLPGMHFFSWAPLYFDTDYLWRAHFHSKGLNEYAWTPFTDKLIDEGSQTLDLVKRGTIYSEIELYEVNDHVPWVFLYAQGLVYGVNKRIDWQPSPDEVISLTRIRVTR